MVNLVFQRGQDVTRLQTAIFCVVPVLVQKVEYLFSSLLAGNEKKLSSSHPFSVAPQKESKGEGSKKTASNFPLADP